MMSRRSLGLLAVPVVVLVMGTALAVRLGGVTAVLLTIGMLAVVSVGVDLVIRGETRIRPTLERFILPNLAVVAAVLFFRLLPAEGASIVGLAGYAGLVVLVIWSELNDQYGAGDRRWSTLGLLVVGYVVAFALFAVIYQAKARTLFNAPAIVAVAFLIALRLLLLSTDELTLLRTATYAALVGLVVGEVTWPLNYWPLNGLFGGAFLLIVLYFLVQTLSRHLAARLTTRTVAEHGMVCLAAAALILWRGL